MKHKDKTRNKNKNKNQNKESVLEDDFEELEDLDYDELTVQPVMGSGQWRMVEQLLEQRWLKQQMSDFDDYVLE